ncbi:MAG TPA: response regulator [Polyangiaceae bacterium]|nr:response regulator [Polyangiaceae bacterium]
MKSAHSRISILLVEDDPAHAEIVLRNLTNLQDRVRCIAHLSDGQQALDYLQRRGEHSDPQSSPRPDLVLLDLRLPRVDGFEVLRRIKASESVSHIPVVVLSTSEAEGDIAAAYQTGACSYLVKPAEFEAYVELIRGLGHYWSGLNRFHGA